MKTLTQETGLDMVVSLLDPKLAAAVKQYAEGLPLTHPLRSPIAVHLMGPLSALLRTQAEGQPLLLGAVTKKASDIINFATTVLVAASPLPADGLPKLSGRTPSWQETYAENSIPRLMEASQKGPEELKSEQGKIENEIKAIQAIRAQLFPDSTASPNLSAQGTLRDLLDKLNTTVGKAAAWAETLPGAKR